MSDTNCNDNLYSESMSNGSIETNTSTNEYLSYGKCNQNQSEVSVTGESTPDGKGTWSGTGVDQNWQF
ncbi:MAG: hypothetical protein IPG00_16330 [Saprospiraceae bacterium]|nr:hypothetical protein [Saprospiraceae bacterium]